MELNLSPHQFAQSTEQELKGTTKKNKAVEFTEWEEQIDIYVINH